MGEISFKGSFVSSDPYRRLVLESYKDQVQNNFRSNTGLLGMVDRFVEIDLVHTPLANNPVMVSALEDFLGEHPEIKTKEQLVDEFYRDGILYCRQPKEIRLAYYYLEGDLIINRKLKEFLIEKPSIKTVEQAIKQFLSRKISNIIPKGEIAYAVDYTTEVYEVITYSGYKEVPLSMVNIDEIESYLDESGKGYTVFKLCHSMERKSLVRLYPKLKGETKLREIEKKVKEEIIRYSHVYFAVKNNKSKVYMFEPKIELQENKVDNDKTKSCHAAHPVYFVGKVWNE